MKHLGYEVSNAHRALADCYFTWQLYQKLNEMRMRTWKSEEI